MATRNPYRKLDKAARLTAQLQDAPATLRRQVAAGQLTDAMATAATAADNAAELRQAMLAYRKQIVAEGIESGALVTAEEYQRRKRQALATNTHG